MKLIRLASISKKLAMGALGAFLLVFLPVHMGLNLCIIRDDGGEWYRNVCHFMGTNRIVKIFEAILILCILCHIVLGIILRIENWQARPVGYAVAQKSKTHSGSKYMILTGVIIFCFLVLHFINFYFAKTGLVSGKYTVKIEKVEACFQQKQRDIYTKAMTNPQAQQTLEKDMSELIQQSQKFNELMQTHATKDFKAVTNLTKEELKASLPADFKDYDADFYSMAQDLFKDPLYVLIYLLVFVVLAIHLFHGVASVFQTYGLNVEKYAKAIDYLSWIYAIVIPVGFAVVPIFIFFFK